MNKLATTFAGISLKNPVIISSSDLTNSPAKNKKLEEEGAAAIILKSLFEEQILMQISSESQNSFDSFMSEHDDYMAQYIRSNQLSEYLSLIRETKAVCTIPVIASLNCFSDSEWESFAKSIEEAGADAIELNIMFIPTDKHQANGSTEQRYIDILKKVRKCVNIPLIIKLTQHITNPLWLIDQLHANGANGVVLFNRMYQPDIDIDDMTYTHGERLGNKSDLGERLRWTGIASAVVKTDYAISGGVHDGKDIVKSILAGASACEICTTLYKNGSGIIKEMTSFIENWLTEKGYESIADCKGIMNASKQGDVNHFERIQFLKYFHKNN